VPVPDSRVAYSPRSDASPETQVSVLATVYRFALDWHAKKGGPHDLTNHRTTETVKNGPQKTQQEKT
jgi:hypothetical protein